MEAYKIENRRTTFLESNEAARLYLLHLFVGASCVLSVGDLSAKTQSHFSKLVDIFYMA